MQRALKVAFIGPGNLAISIARGALRTGVIQPENVQMTCRAGKVQAYPHLQNLGFEVTDELPAVLRFQSDVIVVAVKPQMAASVLGAFKEAYDAAQSDKSGESGASKSGESAVALPVIASTMMGVDLQTLSSHLPPDARVIRVMTNTATEVGAGTTAFVRSADVTEADVAAVRRLFGGVGSVEEVGTEEMLDLATAINGSGPAFAFLFLEAFADGAVAMGVPRDTSFRMATQTLLGSAQLALEGDAHPGLLKDRVCSPGGCTIAGVAALERGGFRAAVMAAAQAATERVLAGKK